jgi:hypothetical protein
MIRGISKSGMLLIESEKLIRSFNLKEIRMLD